MVIAIIMWLSFWELLRKMQKFWHFYSGNNLNIIELTFLPLALIVTWKAQTNIFINWRLIYRSCAREWNEYGINLLESKYDKIVFVKWLEYDSSFLIYGRNSQKILQIKRTRYIEKSSILTPCIQNLVFMQLDRWRFNIHLQYPN